MSRRKIPAAEWTRGTQCRGCVGRACFLLATFSLHEQRKVARSPKGERKPLLLLPALCEGRTKKKLESKAFTPASQERVTLTSRDASRCGDAASVPCAPRGGRGGRRTTCFAQTRAPLRPPVPLRCSARFTAGRSKTEATAKAKATASEASPAATGWQSLVDAGLSRHRYCYLWIRPPTAPATAPASARRSRIRRPPARPAPARTRRGWRGRHRRAALRHRGWTGRYPRR